MSRLPIVDFKTMENVLIRLDFKPVRQKGSHVFYRHLSLPVYFSPVFTDENSPPSNKSEGLPVKIPRF